MMLALVKHVRVARTAMECLVIGLVLIEQNIALFKSSILTAVQSSCSCQSILYPFMMPESTI